MIAWRRLRRSEGGELHAGGTYAHDAFAIECDPHSAPNSIAHAAGDVYSVKRFTANGEVEVGFAVDHPAIEPGKRLTGEVKASWGTSATPPHTVAGTFDLTFPRGNVEPAIRS